MPATEEATPREWREERLRYRILRAVYDRAGGDCIRGVTTPEVGAGVALPPERIEGDLRLLAEYGFLFNVEGDWRYCITPKGIRYIERTAGRRLSVRIPSVH
jgi:hypothetical protein